MTPDQIEQAARELCRMRGKDPDATNDIHYRASCLPWDTTPITIVPVENWRSVAPEVERFAQIGIAIAAVMQREAPAVAMKTPRKKKATKGLDSRPRPV